MTPERAGITELAEAANIARDRAARILREAGIVRDKLRRYPREKSLAALQAAVDPSRAAGHHLTGLGSDASNINLNELATARTDAERARARKLQLDVQEREGSLISKAAAIEGATDFTTYLRNGLLSIGDKVATKCVAKSADAIAAIVNEAIRDALAVLSDEGNFIIHGGTP